MPSNSVPFLSRGTVNGFNTLYYRTDRLPAIGKDVAITLLVVLIRPEP